MSKKALKKYVKELSKEQLEDQILELYTRLKEVKDFYNFVFNPDENKRVEECKFKIQKEYFPLTRRKPKKRRSVAQKCIKSFIKLGMEPLFIADIMLFNIETAVRYCGEHPIRQEAFYISIHRSYTEAQNYISERGLIPDFYKRLENISTNIYEQDWFNKEAFN
ncbi:MAG: hypothetical protein J7K39_00755 [Bacteroidales bacterium]|nr:hypothetical protein [Bacteroidales bacterium]